MSSIWPYIAALIPSAGVGFLFYVVIKNMVEGDRKERLAHSQCDREHESTPADPQGSEKSTTSD